MKQLLTTIAIFMVTSLFIACSDTASESGTNTSAEKETKKSDFDLAAAKKVIDSTNAEFVKLAAKGDSVGLASLYTTDGKMLGANMPAASGRSQIQSAFNGLFTALGPVDLKPTIVDVWGNEDLVAEEGTIVMSKGGKEIDRGKYIVLWKMEDGKWKIFRDCFNSDLPPMPMVPTKK